VSVPNNAKKSDDTVVPVTHGIRPVESVTEIDPPGPKWEIKTAGVPGTTVQLVVGPLAKLAKPSTVKCWPVLTSLTISVTPGPPVNPVTWLAVKPPPPVLKIKLKEIASARAVLASDARSTRHPSARVILFIIGLILPA
jgi:hypothetical protein